MIDGCEVAQVTAGAVQEEGNKKGLRIIATEDEVGSVKEQGPPARGGASSWS